MRENQHATIQEITQHGLDKIPPDSTVTLPARDFMYAYRALEEYIRFFHNRDHYPTVEALQEFLGTAGSGGGFDVLSTAVYQKLGGASLPQEVESLMENGGFEHPLFPAYYGNTAANVK